MSDPGHQLAAGAVGLSHLRASHADREQVICALKAAFVQGMLAKDDFDLRVGQTFASRTYGELSAVTADLPAWVTTASAAGPARAHDDQPVVRPGRVLAAASTAYAGVWAYVFLLSTPGGDNPSAPPLIFISGLVYLGVLLICASAVVALRRERRSGERTPGRPGTVRRPGAPD